MNYTNNANLPEPLCRAIINDPYEKTGHFSVTELLKPPQMARLEKEHADELTEDVSDNIWRLLGQSVHAIIERMSYDFEDSERRVIIDVVLDDGSVYIVSGKPDHAVLLDGIMQDYKVTSAWTHIRELRDEWVDQVNIYARMLFKDCPEKLNSLQIVAIYRDWSKTQMMRSDNYPRQAVAVRDVPLLGFDNIDIKLRGLVSEHLAETPRPCTQEERWQDDPVYAVYKGDNKRATKLCATEEEATQYIAANHVLIKKARVEYRPGINKRCEDYCAVRDYCPQYKELTDGTN